MPKEFFSCQIVHCQIFRILTQTPSTHYKQMEAMGEGLLSSTCACKFWTSAVSDICNRRRSAFIVLMLLAASCPASCFLLPPAGQFSTASLQRWTRLVYRHEGERRAGIFMATEQGVDDDSPRAVKQPKRARLLEKEQKLRESLKNVAGECWCFVYICMIKALS